MRRIFAFLWLMTPGLLLAQQAPLIPVTPLDQRIAHADPSKYRNMKAVHDGPGSLDYRPLFDATSLETNLFFMHRGVIEPKSGIGVHFHNQCEEIFVILDGEAQFTIDGRTSTLKGPGSGSLSTIPEQQFRPLPGRVPNVRQSVHGPKTAGRSPFERFCYAL